MLNFFGASRLPWALSGLTIMIALCFPAMAEAQLRGAVLGTVTDSQNRVIVAAEAVLTNQETNIVRTFQTDSLGFFRFSALEPGIYTLDIVSPGFTGMKREDIQVSALQDVVVQVFLTPSAVTTEVLVTTAGGAELTTSSALIQQTFSQRVVEFIPFTANRDITRLSLLMPLVVRGPATSGMSAGGQRARNNNFTVDGVDNNDTTLNQPAGHVPPEAIREVHVQPFSFSAELGRNTGVQFNAITKSGTNQYHGEVWNYYRGNWLEPLALTNKRAGLTSTPHFVHNQFGGSVGGPIVRDRTFFFGLVQGSLQRQAPTGADATPVNIPTPAGYAVLQNAPLRPGQSQASRNAMLQALSFLPEIHSQVTNYENLSTVFVNGAPVEVGSIRIPLARPQDIWHVTFRADHELSPSARLSYRYHLNHRNQPDFIGNRAFGPRWTASQVIEIENHAFSHIRNFGSRLVNETTVSYVRRDLRFPERDPLTSTTSIGGFFQIGGDSNFPNGRMDNTTQIQNTTSLIAGRHSLKFGVDLRRNTLLSHAGAHSKGTWNFSGLEAFMNNTEATLQQALSEASFEFVQWAQYYFFQDDLRATRDLTINLGLRYETSAVPHGMFGATDPEALAAGVPGLARRDNNNWAPRVGFAYSPSSPTGVWETLLGRGRSSIRGGFGIAYDVLFYNIIINTANNWPRVVNQNDTNLQDVYPALSPKTATAPPFHPINTAFAASTAEDIQNPMTYFWSFSVQRQLGSNYLVELGYVGNRSEKMIRQSQGNPPVLTEEHAATVIAGGAIPSAQARRVNPEWGSRPLIETTAKGEYHSGYIKFERRMARGLLMGASYTWSANFSDNDEALAQTEITFSSPQVPQDFFNYENEWSRSVFDRPHRFVIHYVYEIPSIPGAPAAVQHLLGGWQLAGFTEYQSGQPFTIRTGVDSVGTSAGGTNSPSRPDYNPNGIFTKDPVTGDLRTFFTPIDGTGIVVTPLGSNGLPLPLSMPGGGNLGRNTFRGPSFINWNLSVVKQIQAPESISVELRGDFVNLFNHRNFQNPEARMNNSSFGANTANPLTDSRQITLGTKIRF